MYSQVKLPRCWQEMSITRYQLWRNKWRSVNSYRRCPLVLGIVQTRYFHSSSRSICVHFKVQNFRVNIVVKTIFIMRALYTILVGFSSRWKWHLSKTSLASLITPYITNHFILEVIVCHFPNIHVKLSKQFSEFMTWFIIFFKYCLKCER